MPRQTRASSGSHNPYSSYPAVSLGPSPMYPQQRMSMPADSFYIPSSGSSSMPLAPPQTQMPESSFDSYPASSAPAVGGLPQSHRPSSGAWTIQDDQQLMNARAQGLNWGQIKESYFPTKSANACRKRHERLAERRDADDWDNRKMQRLAKEYMAMRKEIWSGLAARTGEKWNVVEQKIMSNGLKNLQSAARAATRHDRLQSQNAAAAASAGGGPLSGYDDDSGISGIALTPVDELDASYSSPETSSSSGGAHSAASSTASAPGYHHHHHSSMHLHPQQAIGGSGSAYLGSYGYPAAAAHHHNGHRYSSSVSSTASAGHPYGDGHSQSSSPYMRGQRLSSVDMGIGAIINRPGGGRL